MLAYLVLQLLFAAEPGRRLDALLCHTTVDNHWQFYFTPCFRHPLTQICRGAQPPASSVQGGCSPPPPPLPTPVQINECDWLLFVYHGTIMFCCSSNKTSLVPRPLPDFISQPRGEKSGEGLVPLREAVFSPNPMWYRPIWSCDFRCNLHGQQSSGIGHTGDRVTLARIL